MSTLTLTVENLGKRFNREWIFRGISKTFHGGKTYAITGSNGAGKSTLLQVLWGQVPPTTGNLTYQIGDRLIPVEEIYKHLVIATPYIDLIDEFTLSEQLRFHMSLKPLREGLSEAALLAKMELTTSANKRLANFSSGMKQRVKLALAFYTQADIVFLDEPGTNLDEHAFQWYLHQLSTLPTNCLVFIASNQSAEYASASEEISLAAFK